MNKKFVLPVFACLSLIIAKSQSSFIFKTGEGALHGYDPVSYFTEKNAVKGYDSLSYPWKGANWHFSSRRNLDSFRIHPDYFQLKEKKMARFLSNDRATALLFS